jgi:murein DD-endopeptidase MepM/ murein hydrolase activator NlpD
MGKINYRFNPETLSYDKVDHSFKKLLKKVGGYLITSALFAIVFSILFLTFYKSPRLAEAKRENRKLLSQYNLLDKDLDKMSSVLEEVQSRDDNIYRVIFEADPIPTTVRKAGFGGVNSYSHLESLSNSELVTKITRKLDILSKQIYIQSKSYDEIIELALSNEDRLASKPSIMPVSNKDLKRTASGFKFRIHPIYKIRKFHYGMDFSAPTGTKIFATGNGVVKEVKTFRNGYGKSIKIDHGYGFATLYGHLNSFNVKKGQKIKRGDVIGFVGNTGTSTAPHLHYEVHKKGKAVNPIHYYFQDLTADEYEKMVAISSNMGQSFD